MRKTLAVFLLLLGICALPAAARAQAVECSASRTGAGAYQGNCARGGSPIGTLAVQPVLNRPAGVWRGMLAQARDTVVLTFDTRPDGALQHGRRWLALVDVAVDSVTIRFAYHEDSAARASAADVEILRRARRFLEDESRWNRADTTDMDAAPVRGFSCAPAPSQSLFCAAYLASMEVVGDYAHFRPAMTAIREALATVARQRYRHPLVDFNNDPGTNLDQVHATLDLALQLVNAQRARR